MHFYVFSIKIINMGFTHDIKLPALAVHMTVNESVYIVKHPSVNV